MNQEETINKPKIRLRKVIKILSWVLFSFIILFISIFIIVFTYETEITNKVLNKLNKSINGEITISSLQVDPFKQYPNISIDLKGTHIKNSNKKTIIKVDAFYIGFDVIEILKGTYDIKEITLEKGIINIINDKDGLNIENIFPIDTSITEKEIDKNNKPITLTLKQLNLEDVTISYVDKIKKENLSIQIDKIETNIDYNIIKDIVNLNFETEFQLLKTSSLEDKNILNKKINLETKLKYNLKSNYLDLQEFKLKTLISSLNAKGSINLKNENLQDVKIILNINDINKLKPIIDQYIPSSLDIIKYHSYKGKIRVNLIINGSFNNPNIEANTRIEKFSLKNKASNLNIYELTTEIIFKGKPLDSLFDPEINIENLKLNTNFLILDGKLKMKNRNYTSADIKLSITDLNALKNNFNIYELNGYNVDEVYLKIKFRGLDVFNENIISKILDEHIELDVVNLRINNNNFPVKIKRGDVQLYIKNNNLDIPILNLKTEKSDFDIKFNLNNLKSFTKNKDDIFNANLKIKSKKLELNEFLYFDSLIDNKYGDVFYNTELDFNLKSNYNDCVNYQYIPKGEFNLNKFTTKPDHLFSEIKEISTKVFIDDSTIKINDFTFLIGHSDIHINSSISNYESIFNDKNDSKFRIKKTITAKDIYTEDFNYFDGKKIIHKDYDHEDIRNLHTTIDFEINMKDINEGVKNIPDLKFKIDHLNLELPNRNFILDSTVLELNSLNDNIFITDIHSHFGNSNIKINGELIQPFTYLEGHRKDDIKINIESKNIDVDQIFTFTTTEYQKKIEQKRLDTNKRKKVKTDTNLFNIGPIINHFF